MSKSLHVLFHYTICATIASTTSAVPSSLVNMCGCGNCNFHTILQHGCPTPKHGSRFPYLNTAGLTQLETSLLLNKLSEDFEDLVSKYDTLIMKFQEWIEQNINVAQFKTILLTLNGIKSPRKEVLSFADREVEIQHATTHDELSIIVTKYVNWFQYSLLQRIVGNICKRFRKDEHEFKHDVDLYEKELTKYCKRTVFECPTPSSFPLKPGTKYLRLKLDERFDPEKLEANEIRRIEGMLTNTLDLYPDTLELICINKGCIEMISSIPTSVHSSIFPLDNALLKELTLIGVTEIDSDGYQALINKEPPHLLRHVMVRLTQFALK